MRIFISYSRQNQQDVKGLAQDFEDLQHDVWFDRDLVGGQDWWVYILAQIREADLFVYAVGPEALKSLACQREFTYACDLHIRILPIKVADEVSMPLLPPGLAKVQFVDYSRQDKAAFVGLTKALSKLPHPEPLPHPLPEPPERPVSKLGQLKEQIETASALGRKEQAELVLALKDMFHEPQHKRNVLSLFKRLRERDDLLAMISKEIDRILDTVARDSTKKTKRNLSTGVARKKVAIKNKSKPKVASKKVDPKVKNWEGVAQKKSLISPLEDAFADNALNLRDTPSIGLGIPQLSLPTISEAKWRRSLDKLPQSVHPAYQQEWNGVRTALWNYMKACEDVHRFADDSIEEINRLQNSGMSWEYIATEVISKLTQKHELSLALKLKEASTVSAIEKFEEATRRLQNQARMRGERLPEPPDIDRSAFALSSESSATLKVLAEGFAEAFRKASEEASASHSNDLRVFQDTILVPIRNIK